MTDVLERLKSGELSRNTYALLHEFGEADFQDAEQTVASYLSSPDPELRFIALSVLVMHWQRPEYRGASERMLSDSDSDVRRMAVDAVAVLTAGTRDAQALALLLQRIDDPEEEWHVRDTAYDAVLRTLGRKPTGYARLGKPIRWPDDADPVVVAEARALAESRKS